MAKTIDARGLACPQPVLLAKRAIAENGEVTVLVDNAVAVENIRRLAEKTACGFSVADKGGGTLEIVLTGTGGRESADHSTKSAVVPCKASPEQGPGPFVVVLSDNRMGRGDDVLGDILIRSFLHALLELNPLPDAILCYNAGVKLAAEDSTVLDDLRQLAQAGVNILVCGTCVNYFALQEKIAVGHISNMYDIAETMAGASRLVRP